MDRGGKYSFQNLKKIMCEAPVLALPDFSKLFELETDACDKGIGAVLMQGGMPIAYYSKALCPKNQRLSTYEKELIAILDAVEKWRHYLEPTTFILRTDHSSLKYLLQQKMQTQLQKKSLTKLLGLSYEIHYKRGQENKAGGHQLFVKLAPPKRSLCLFFRQIIRICAGVQQQEPTGLSL